MTRSNVDMMPLSYTSDSYAYFSLGPCSVAVNQGLTIYFKMSTCIPKVRKCDYLNKGTKVHIHLKLYKTLIVQLSHK